VRILILFLLGPYLWAAPVVKTVCGSGCDYTNAELQTALNDAQRGWILELKAGEYFDTATSFYLPAKTGSGWITIRSSRLAELPAGKRVSPADADKMPKVRTSGWGYDPVIRTSGKPSSYWRMEGLEITLTTTGLSSMGNLIQLGGGDENSPEKISHHFAIDRCYIHGYPFDQGPWRGILHNADHVTITNNYLSEIKLLASTAESQVLGSWSHNGPLEVRNNFVSGGSINSLVGGAWPYVSGMYPMFLRYIGNYYFKPGEHQVIRYRADPVGTVLPSTGHLSQPQPARGQTFWKTDTQELFFAWADPVDGDPWAWYPASGVAPNRVCIDGAFWRNESATPRYWECRSGNWVEVFSDRTVTGITGSFKGWGVKNQWEIKGATGVWKEGNITENTFYPTFGNQVGSSHLLNWLPGQGGPPSTIRDIYVRHNKSRRTAAGPFTGKIIVDATVTSATSGNPTVLTCSSGTSMGSSGLKSVIIRNATGEWAGINGRWIANRTSSTTFEIPYDSTGFSSLTGSPSVRVQDETISMRHLWPLRIVFENNIWESMGEAANMVMSDCCASTSISSGYAYSVTIGRTAQLGFPGTVFAHNTVIKPHNGATLKMGAGVAPYKLSWAGALGDVPTRNNQWRDNLEETGYVVVNNSDEGEVGCDYAFANQWPDAWLDKNVLVQTGQYAISHNTSYYDQVCPTWAWPWKRSEPGVRANITGGEVTADAAHCAGAGGNRLTLTLDLGHGLYPNTVFDVTAATPGDIVGRYVVPMHRYSGGLLVTQTQGTLEVCTAAPVGSYGGITVEASAGYTDYANGNFRLAAGSQYKGFATDGSDPGANQDMVEWATETAESGEPNPYLDMGVKIFIPAVGGGEFRFTAYSDAACTWQISSTRAFADSLGSVSQTRAGRYGVATLSGLSAGHYWYKLTCEGKYRDGEIVTR